MSLFLFYIPSKELHITCRRILSSFIVCEGEEKVLEPDLQICTTVVVRLFLKLRPLWLLAEVPWAL